MISRFKILFSLAWAADRHGFTMAKADKMPVAAIEERNLAFACTTDEVDLSVYVFSGFNGCYSGAFKNLVTVSTSDGRYTKEITSRSVNGKKTTFNDFLDIGCLSQDVSYIQFELSYQMYDVMSTKLLCMTVQDSMWATAFHSGFDIILSDGKSNITYSKTLIFPPSPKPTQAPTIVPTQEPTSLPSLPPSVVPTLTPTQEPTSLPSLLPSVLPTLIPTQEPTLLPSLLPSVVPTLLPTHEPTSLPSLLPSQIPTLLPTQEPTSLPSLLPTLAPTFLPTHEPTSLPSLAPSLTPTLVPSSAPTITCTSGYYYDREKSSCAECPVGHFSNYSSGYFNFSTCMLCPAGQFTDGTGSGSCTACASGKLSQPSRVSCADCSEGEYARDDIDCVFCPTGQYAPQPLTGSCLPCAAGFKTNKKIAATTCSACSAGTICTVASTCALNCSGCPNGTYSLSGQSACTFCIPGW